MPVGNPVSPQLCPPILDAFVLLGEPCRPAHGLGGCHERCELFELSPRRRRAKLRALTVAKLGTAALKVETAITKRVIGRQMNEAEALAARDARRLHKQTGHPMAVWREAT